MKKSLRKLLSSTLLLASMSPLAAISDEPAVLRIDHYVPVQSKAPVMEKQLAQLYVRERTLAAATLRSANLEGQVVLFIHGAGTPAEVAFDVPVKGYSWMSYLAMAGYDTFAMDTTGYGRSTRPYVMNDVCNLSAQAQQEFIPAMIPEPCEPSYAYATTTIESDWHDIDNVVEYIRTLRGVEKVHLVAWSLGGPRAAGYAAQHPEKVERVVILAPAYSRTRSATAPESLPAPGVAFSKQSHQDFVRNWDRQVGCEAQYDPEVREAIWQDMLASDSVGATWGAGVRRAPVTSVWGWNQQVVSGTMTPMLLVAGVHDAQFLLAA